MVSQRGGEDLWLRSATLECADVADGGTSCSFTTLVRHSIQKRWFKWNIPSLCMMKHPLIMFVVPCFWWCRLATKFLNAALWCFSCIDPLWWWELTMNLSWQSVGTQPHHRWHVQCTYETIHRQNFSLISLLHCQKSLPPAPGHILFVPLFRATDTQAKASRISSKWGLSKTAWNRFLSLCSY